MVLKINQTTGYEIDRSSATTPRDVQGVRQFAAAVHIKARIEGQLVSLATLTGASKSIGGATSMVPYTVMHYNTSTAKWEPWITGETVDGVILPNSEDQDQAIAIHATEETLVVIGTDGEFHYDHIIPIVSAQRAALDTALKTNSRLIVDDIVGRRG